MSSPFKKSTLFGLLLLFFCLPIQSFAKQKILVIESYHSEYLWDKSYKEGIQSVLKDDFELVYFQMDTKRLSKFHHQTRADLAWDFFQETNPDLVILGDDNALKYLGVQFSNTKTPVIYLGVNNNPRHYNIHQSKNISGVLERPLIKRSILMTAQLLPQKVSRVLFVLDNSNTAQVILQEMFDSQTQMTVATIDVQIKLIGDWDTWQKTLLSAADENYDALFIGSFHTLTDRAGKHISAAEIIDWSSKNTPIPPFGLWDFSVGKERTIGGLVIFGDEQGKLAATMAKEVLQTGKQPYQIRPQTAEKGHYLFSRQALQEYGLILPEKIAKKTIFMD